MKKVTDGSRKIVIAEKDEEVRHLLSEFLKLQGFSVMELERPERLQVECSQEPPDLLLLGHGSSEEETFDALGAVREQECFDGVPVIVIAVDPDEGFLTKVVSRGADSLLPFPFPMEILQERIDDLLEGRRTPLMP
ncbi:MAG: response regulator [Planctomycetota bacterium]|jgi:DNA-binding response OmpR family regulator